MSYNMDSPSQTYGKNETHRVYHRDLPARKQADYTFRPDCEHHENLIAEAERYRLLSRLAPGQTWQRRLCSRMGRWLAALGRSLESYGNQPAVQANASGISSR